MAHFAVATVDIIKEEVAPAEADVTISCAFHPHTSKSFSSFDRGISSMSKCILSVLMIKKTQKTPVPLWVVWSVSVTVLLLFFLPNGSDAVAQAASFLLQVVQMITRHFFLHDFMAKKLISTSV